MAGTNWMIKGHKIGVCSCAYGCPCEFNARPTYGVCEGGEIGVVESGHFGDVRLDGVRFAAIYRWPGPLHEGGGEAQTVIDESASRDQREGLLEIFSGKHSAPGTIFPILAATMAKEHETLYRPIQLECDMRSRNGRAAVPGLIAISTGPIRNPATGAEYRARIDLPGGWEFRRAEVGAGDIESTGGVKLDLADRHAFLCEFAYDRNGMI